MTSDDENQIQRAQDQLRTGRRVLEMDELARLEDRRPRWETELKLPGDGRGSKNRIHFFSISGMLDGKPVVGALMAGECILVQAFSIDQAQRIAREGLEDTVRLAREYFEQQQMTVQPAPAGVLEQGLSTDAGGRKASESQRPLNTDPKLKAMLAHIIGGLPWKW